MAIIQDGSAFFINCAVGENYQQRRRDGEHWRAEEDIEQIGIIQQELVDLLGTVINKVHP